VINQGTLDATDVVVTDYYPTSTTLSTADTNGWIDAGTSGTLSIANVPTGTTTTVQIALTIDPNFSGTEIYNNAEITQANNTEGLEDQDDPIVNQDGSSDDQSQSPTDNDVDDEFPGTE